MLQVKDLEAGYGHLQVLWGLSLEVSEGDFVALIGPNGAGKSTTLRTVGGLLEPKAGEVTFAGRPVAGLPAHEIHRIGISLIPETLHLFQRMTVLENLLLGAYSIGQRAKISESLDYVFQLFPVLEDRRSQLAGTLSGGERKMLALGRGLMGRPRILLIDEPSLGLAPKLALSVFEALVELNHQGITMLLVEQNVRMTLEITDRAYVMEQGKIVLEGASTELVRDPYVKRAYLGSG